MTPSKGWALWLPGGMAVLFVAYALLAAPWIARRQAQAIRYRLDGPVLRVDEGFINLRRKSIPLEKITNIDLRQNYWMRVCGIWSLDIQTAGTGQPNAEASLYGLEEPERVRDEILRRKEQVAAGR